MPEPKAPYKLTIKLSGARPDRLAEALNALRDCLSDHDQSGETSATAVVECWKEASAREVADVFEDWLYHNAPGLESEMRLHRPGIRPETIAMHLREKQLTPMDREWQQFADENNVSVHGTILGHPVHVEPDGEDDDE